MHTNAIIAATRTTFESKEESITGKLILRNTNIGVGRKTPLQFHTKDSSRAAVRTFRASERWFPGKSASQNTKMATKRRDSECQGH